MIEENTKLSAQPPEHKTQNFAELREEGLAVVRMIAEQSWTDHNVHDPGITFLEAYIYGLTDLGLRTNLDMRDLIQSGEKITAPDLAPAHEVLPCAPVTEMDLRKLVLDHYLIEDAAVSSPVDTEIPIYHDGSVQPPLSYAPGNGERLRVSGLYEVAVELQQAELNSNAYLINVEYDGNTYSLDIALPHWDEPESSPFHEEVSIDAVTLIDSGSGIWRRLEESLTYFTQARVEYTGSAGPGISELWLVMRIVDQLTQPAALAPNITAAAVAVIEGIGDQSLMRQYATRVLSASSVVGKLDRYLHSWRNLSELPVRISVVRTQEIAVRARIEINNGIDLELLVAKIFQAIDAELSPPTHFDELDDLRADGLGARDIYEGPLLKHGFLTAHSEHNPLSADVPGEIYVSDILRIIMRLRDDSLSDVTQREAVAGRDILAVSELMLSNYVNNRLITKGARDCLHLVEVQYYRPRLSIAKSRINLVHDDVEVSYDFLRVEELFQALRAQNEVTGSTEASARLWPVEQGESFPVDDYYPFQNDLPRVYGVGEHGLPDSATTQRKAQALQTKAYLMLGEQYLADTTAQLININRFFSPKADEQQTYFVNPIYELPGIDRLLTHFPLDGDWQAFIDDADNAYRTALRQAIESRADFVDRRNRMLDHLLARQGVEALAWSQELHRWAYEELKSAGLPANEFQSRLDARRLEVNEALINMKAAFLDAVPRLNAARLQAFAGNVREGAYSISVESNAPDYTWRLNVTEALTLEAENPAATHAEACLAAEDAAVLALQSLYYEVVSAGGGRFRFLLREGENSNDQVIARSVQTWSSIAAAQSAIDEVTANLIASAIRHSLATMERIIAHQCGFPLHKRALLNTSDLYFEIYDEVDSDAVIEKRWRLWSGPGNSGNILLSSVYHFVAPPEIVDPIEQDAVATALAQEAIEQVIRFGIHRWHYLITEAGADTFNFELRTNLDEQIALYTPPLPSIEATEERIQTTTSHLLDLYSGEGFHLVEHILLRPMENSDPFLAIPIDETQSESDPYSHRVSLVFPSGYARDFSDTSTTPELTEVTPHRFRDRQFRKYVQRVVEQTCPAHILPTLYWVDQQLPGSADDPASFNSFENHYMNWLRGQLIAGTPESTLTDNRVALINSLNSIANA